MCNHLNKAPKNHPTHPTPPIPNHTPFYYPTGLQKQGYVITEAEARQLMEKMDVDHSGNVEGDEFVAALIDWWVGWGVGRGWLGRELTMILHVLTRPQRANADITPAHLSTPFRHPPLPPTPTTDPPRGQIMQTKEWESYVDAAFDRLDTDQDGGIDLVELMDEMPVGFLEGCAGPCLGVGGRRWVEVGVGVGSGMEEWGFGVCLERGSLYHA